MTTIIRVIVLACMVTAVIAAKCYFKIENQQLDESQAKTGDIVISPIRLSYERAEEECKKHKGHLMNLDTEEKYHKALDCLKDLLKEWRERASSWTKGKAVNGSWKWDNGQNVTQFWCGTKVPVSKPGERIILTNLRDMSRSCYTESEDGYGSILCEYV